MITVDPNNLSGMYPGNRFLKTILEEEARILKENGVKDFFTEEMCAECQLNNADRDVARVDLRGLLVFPIDCDDTQDRDDAISVSFDGTSYHVGVHIADVSAYVRPGTALACEAMRRGSSIYLPTVTIPMLPSILSENLCALSDCGDKYTVSTLMDFDAEGHRTSFRIVRSIIRPAIMASYSEVNRVLGGNRYRSSWQNTMIL